MPFPTVSTSIHRHEATTHSTASDILPERTSNATFPTNTGRRGRDRASAPPPPTNYGLQFLDLSDDSNEITPTSGKAHSIGGLPVRARTLVDRKRECLRVPEPERTEPRRVNHDEEPKADEGQRDRGERPAHGRSKSQPASSIRIGNPGRPYYSAIRPNMNVGASFSQPSSPVRTTYDSRPSSRGVSPRPGSSAAYLSTSYPASRASSPAPSSYHNHPKTKSFLDIDVLDDEEYLFSSLTPPSATCLCPILRHIRAIHPPDRNGFQWYGVRAGKWGIRESRGSYWSKTNFECRVPRIKRVIPQRCRGSSRSFTSPRLDGSAIQERPICAEPRMEKKERISTWISFELAYERQGTGA